MKCFTFLYGCATIIEIAQLSESMFMMRNAIRRLPLPDSGQAVLDIYIPVMLLFFPLFTGFSGYAAITVSKYLFFVISASVMFAALLTLRLRRRIAPERSAPTQLFAAAFMAAACLSAVLSGDFIESLAGAGRFDGLITWLFYFLVFLCVSRFGRMRRSCTAAFAVSVMFCCVVAVLQLAGHDPFRLFPEGLDYYDAHIRYTGEFLGTIGNVDLLSSMLCMAAALFFSLASCRSGRLPLLYLIPLAFSVFVLTASKVAAGAVALAAFAVIAPPVLFTSASALRRGLCAFGTAFISAALALGASWRPAGGEIIFSFDFPLVSAGLFALGGVSLAASCVLMLWNGGADPRTMSRALTALSAAVCVCALVLIYRWPGGSGTLWEMSRVLHGEFNDSFGSSRIRIWRRTLELFKERPILGSGPGTLASLLDITFSRFVPETGQTLTSCADNAHNVYLQLLAETGILGLSAYLGCAVTALAPCLRLRASAEAKCAALGCITYLVQAFFGLELCLTAPLFWIFLGLAASESIHS